MQKHVSITISGKVQGVGFRYCTIDKALELGIKGIVKNYEQNKVMIEAEGDVDALQSFMKWCRQGPQGAQVDNFDYQSTDDLQKYEDFTAEL